MEAQHSRRTVAVGVDGSRSALRAVQWAAAEATRRKLPLRIVMALEWQESRARGRLGADYPQIMLGEGERLLAQAVAIAEKTMPVNEVEHELIVGSPIPVLRAESRNAALLVVGDPRVRSDQRVAARRTPSSRNRAGRSWWSSAPAAGVLPSG
jgi:nucleotide-binding universal stress UspA family protein